MKLTVEMEVESLAEQMPDIKTRLVVETDEDGGFSGQVLLVLEL